MCTFTDIEIYKIYTFYRDLVNFIEVCEWFKFSSDISQFRAVYKVAQSCSLNETKKIMVQNIKQFAERQNNRNTQT